MRFATARTRRGLVAACLLAAASATLWAAEPPAAPKVSTFAPAADLLEQVNYFVARTDESLADPKDYDEAKQSRTKKDANALAVLGLALGLHDQDNAIKPSASALVKASQALAKGSKSVDDSAKALADVKAAVAGTAKDDTQLKWEKVGGLGQLMKQVAVVNTSLSRSIGGTRFAKQAQQSAGQAATLAVIAQASIYDTHEVKDPADIDKWYKWCAEMRDAAFEINAACHAGDQAKAAEANKRMLKSCEDCHAVFRKEEK